MATSIGKASAASSQIDAVVTDRDYYVSVSAGTTIPIEVEATAGGGLGVGEDLVSVTYNVQNYSLYLSMVDGTTTLKKSDDNTKTIPMTTSTSYATLAPDYWGFNVGVQSNTEANARPYGDGDEEESRKFRAIPVAGSEINIGSGSGVKDEQNHGYHVVRYGVKASMSTPAGLYQGKVKYTVMGNLGTVSGSISPSTVGEGVSTTIKFSTNIMTNMSYGTWTMTVGGTDCTNVQTDTVNGFLVISCTVPTTLSKGFYNVVASSTKYGTFTAQNQLTVAETYTYTLSYNLNGGSSSPSVQTGTTAGAVTLTIPKTEPTKYRQVFLGWADTQDEANALIVKHKLYDASGTNKINLSASNPSATLWAVWAGDITNESIVDSCKWGRESTTGNVTNYIMADPRDKKLYVTRKLKDGQCWMVQNLDLDIAMQGTTMGTINTLTNEFVKFTSSNTNLSGSEWTITGSNKGYATQISAGEAWDNYGRNKDAASDVIDSSYEVRSYDIDKGDPNSACYTDGITARACTTAVGAADVTRAGNYYNWPAATAGTGTYSTTGGTDVAGSICPAGWQLPYGNNGTGTNGGNTAKGFYYLLNSLGTSSDAPLLANPYSYLRAGYYNYDGYMDYQGSNGNYWSRMANNQNNAYYLSFTSSAVHPGTNNYRKGLGFSVRCVLYRYPCAQCSGDL